MPIAPELRQFYRTPQWFEARGKVKARAKGKCEWCGKPKGNVRVALDQPGRWYDEQDEQWVRPPSMARALERMMIDPFQFEMERPRAAYTVRCVLTTAHLDRNPGNDALDNLAALCQRCHLVYDAAQHRQNARLRRDRETGQLRLELVAC